MNIFQCVDNPLECRSVDVKKRVANMTLSSAEKIILVVISGRWINLGVVKSRETAVYEERSGGKLSTKYINVRYAILDS